MPTWLSSKPVQPERRQPEQPVMARARASSRADISRGYTASYADQGARPANRRAASYDQPMPDNDVYLRYTRDERENYPAQIRSLTPPTSDPRDSSGSSTASAHDVARANYQQAAQQAIQRPTSPKDEFAYPSEHPRMGRRYRPSTPSNQAASGAMTPVTETTNNPVALRQTPAPIPVVQAPIATVASPGTGIPLLQMSEFRYHTEPVADQPGVWSVEMRYRVRVNPFFMPGAQASAPQ